MSDLTDILDFLAKGTPWAFVIILIAIIIYFLINPGKVEKWSSLISKIFSFTSKKIEKHYISKDIEYKINSFGKDINDECEELVPYPTEVKFIKPSSFKKESVEHFEDKLIIFLKDRHNQDENFIKAALLSTEQTLIPNSRHYIEPMIMRSIDLQYVKNLIISKNRNKLNSYIDNVFAPELENSTIIESNIQVLERLSEQGIFTRILLQELKDFGMIFYPKSVSNSIVNESKDFFSVLRELAHKKHHEDVRLNFIGENIKIGFVLIGIPRKVYRKEGIDTSPYIQRILKYEEDGIKTLYLLGWSSKIDPTKKVSQEIDLMPDRFEKISESLYNVKLDNNKKIEAICVRYRVLVNTS
ncbi:hypothetical protein LCGC14_1393590 [marine sediment metagenome]|uniref:Uncharacterized protein n=1 Tax=marine sediment metagenome TaxID=412755 RepID=A0A0F9N0T2_9ZZZZ